MAVQVGRQLGFEQPSQANSAHRQGNLLVFVFLIIIIVVILLVVHRICPWPEVEKAQESIQILSQLSVMHYIVLRATTRSSGLFRSAPSLTRSITGSRLRILSSDMASDSGSQGDKGFVLHSIRSLNQGESKYVRPVRMHFTLNGRTRAWDCLKVHDSVACVIYNKTRNKLIYVKQFRPAVYLSTLTSSLTDMSEFDATKLPAPTDKNVGYTMELCAGLADKDGKTAQQVMQEEISEETGYNVPLESIKFISSFRGSTGLSGTSQILYFVEVTDDQKSNQGGGVDDEAIEVLELDIEEARKTLYCRDEDAPLSRPPAMLFGTGWFLNEYLPKLNK